MSDEQDPKLSSGDPFVDPSDPDAVERDERRREREAKRAQKAAKQKKGAPPPPPPKEEPPAVPRTPEQEFWDEPADPATPPPPAAPPQGEQPKAGKEKRGFFSRRKDKTVAAGAAAGAAAASENAEAAPPADPPSTPQTTEQPAPPTGEVPAPPAAETPAPPTGEKPVPPTAETALPTAETAVPPAAADEPAPPASQTPSAPVAEQAGPPTAETSLPPAAEQPAAPTAESPVPPTREQPAASTPQPDPGPNTAEAPRPDPNRPTVPLVPPPSPVDQTGAGDWEPPPPRDDLFDDQDFHDDGDPTMAGAARTGRRHGEDHRRGGGIVGKLLRHPYRIIAAIIVILILLFLNSLFQPFHGEGSGKVEVTIPKGSSVGEVGDLLEKKGVISGGIALSGSTLFQMRVTIAGKRSDLFAGKFIMAKDMSYGDAIDELSKEPAADEPKTKPGVETVTIPEGQSRPITAKLVKEDGIKGNYMKKTVKSKYLDPADYGGKHAKNLEGFLFPDTWEIKTSKPVSYLVRLQLEDFKKKIKKVNMKYAKSKNLTVYDVITIASMLEREAPPKQQKLVASVIYNRLHEGMTLGIDSTIRFATGNYEKPLTQSELESESPYNTRTHAGLPPGPINSPGLAAMQAAAHPKKSNYLFYVTDPKSCNELTFAKTEDEFFADVEKYEKAREANGGNQPSTCK